MKKRTREEKIDIAREIAVELAPYLWDRSWGFGLNMYFDDVHIDYRELSAYLFSEEQADDRDTVLGHFEDACVEFGEFEDEKYAAYKDILALDSGIEMYISCEQEIYEEIYLYLWDGMPAGKGMVDAFTDVFRKHGLIWDLEDYSIEVYNDEPE
ncbi:MAG: hypothetical protein J6P16_03060 [Eubacterium sp.]|nr:hypothetical protein [Eubacterium sp.]